MWQTVKSSIAILKAICTSFQETHKPSISLIPDVWKLETNEYLPTLLHAGYWVNQWCLSLMLLLLPFS
ncbi:vacuolar-sorting receptor [Trifolium repens]|nr:vacuolar-sorting receptor [Trifolium repens]